MKQEEQAVLLKSKIQDIAKVRQYRNKELDEKFKKGNEKVQHRRENDKEYI